MRCSSKDSNTFDEMGSKLIDLYNLFLLVFCLALRALKCSPLSTAGGRIEA